MRYGFTTGSCAAAAAKAAAYLLLTGREKRTITVETPAGIRFCADIAEIRRGEDWVQCAVRKDGGDDPDVTTGALICARVSFREQGCKDGDISIEGGAGVGRVTRPGLDQPVGAAAINHVPRAMIEREVREVCDAAGHTGGLFVEISVPEGEALAERTFNPRLGIAGGISILGTTGIVEPMSRRALLDTIRVELAQRRAEGAAYVAVSPGSYGQEFLRQTYGFDPERSVRCGNFIGETIDMGRELGFRGMLLIGHIGKLVKLSGGIMNTHSREADCRMELLAAAALFAGGSRELLERMLSCAATEEALALLAREEPEGALLSRAMGRVLERAVFYLNARAGEGLRVECLIYANACGELAKSAGASALLARIQTDPTAE